MIWRVVKGAWFTLIFLSKWNFIEWRCTGQTCRVIGDELVTCWIHALHALHALHAPGVRCMSIRLFCLHFVTFLRQRRFICDRFFVLTRIGFTPTFFLHLPWLFFIIFGAYSIAFYHAICSVNVIHDGPSHWSKHSFFLVILTLIFIFKRLHGDERLIAVNCMQICEVLVVGGFWAPCRNRVDSIADTWPVYWFHFFSRLAKCTWLVASRLSQVHLNMKYVYFIFRPICMSSKSSKHSRMKPVLSPTDIRRSKFKVWLPVVDYHYQVHLNITQWAMICTPTKPSVLSSQSKMKRPTLFIGEHVCLAKSPGRVHLKLAASKA